MVRLMSLILRELWCLTDYRKQLYYIFDTTPGANDYFIEPIDLFYRQIKSLIEFETNDPDCKYKSPSPSARANIWAQLFPIHPVASTDPKRHSLNNCNYDGGCVICLEDFEPTFIIVKLHCSHLFHYTCVRTMWDRPGITTLLCPICRTNSIRWSLHEQTGIQPEVVDVWDNEATVGEARALEHTDTTEENNIYWMYENLKLASSRRWNDEKGDQPRDVRIEMVHVRQARRLRDQRMRSLISLTDKVEGLDSKSLLD